MAGQDALRDYYVDKIHELGYVPAEFSISGADIDPLFELFGEVLDEAFGQPGQHGQDVVSAFHTTMPGRPYDSATFLDQRRVGQKNPYEPDSRPATENKDVLHFSPITRVMAGEYMRSRGGMSNAMRKLLEGCVEVQQAVRTSVAPVFDALGVKEIMLSPLSQNDVHILRMIRYLGQSSAAPFIDNDNLASLHFDRSKFTAALWEDRPGLVGAPGNNLLGNPELTVDGLDGLSQRALSSPISHRSGRLKLFAGAGYNRLPAQLRQASGNLPLLLHGVNDHAGQERHSIVDFMNEQTGVVGIPLSDRSERGIAQLRQAVTDKQRRYGGLLEDAS